MKSTAPIRPNRSPSSDRKPEEGKPGKMTPLYLRAGLKLSLEAPKAGETAHEEYSSDPAKPVPFVRSETGRGQAGQDDAALSARRSEAEPGGAQGRRDRS